MSARTLSSSDGSLTAVEEVRSNGPGALARGLLAGLGLAAVAMLIWRIGAEAILGHLRALGWTIVFAVPPHLVAMVLDVLGWRYAFARPVPLGLLRLTMIHLGGRAVNLVTPLVPVGGEPLKAYLLRRRGVPLAEGLASVVISKTLVTIALGIFVVGVSAIAFARLDLPVALVRAVLATVAVGALLVGGFVLAQACGLFGGLLGILRRAGLGLPALDAGARDLDGRVTGYYREHPGRLVAALGLHLLGWVADALEVWVLLSLLDLPRSITSVLALTAFSSAVRAAAFAVPAGLGAQEGGTVFLFLSFGLPADAAMAFSALRRLRELVWGGAGLLFLSWSGVRWSPGSALAPPDEDEPGSVEAA